ncbi:MAG: AraC family transcriptional regulator [Planctomycetota bacterium]
MIDTQTFDQMTLLRRRHVGEEGVRVDEGMSEHVLVYNPTPPRFSEQRRDGTVCDDAFTRRAVNLLPAHEAFAWDWAFDRPAESTHVCLSPTLLRKVAQEVGDMDPDRVQLRHGINLDDESLLRAVRLLEMEMSRPSVGTTLFADSMARVLAIHLLRNHCVEAPRESVRPGRLSGREFAAAREFLEANLRRDFGLEEWASAAGVDATGFIRRFRWTAGVSPHRYLAERRVARARKMLMDRRYSVFGIMVIAKACGFASEAQMNRCFQGIVGVMPETYRASHGGVSWENAGGVVL